jgi:hypothetical protein
MEEQMTISVRKIPVSLWSKVRATALLQGKPLEEFVKLALFAAVNGKKVK